MKTWHKAVAGTGSALAICLGLVWHYEGENLHANRDVGGTLQICDGETHGVYPGMTATHAQCLAWATKEVNQNLAFIDKRLVKKQPEPRRAALSDFAYNEGLGRLEESGILEAINRGDIMDACYRLLKYDTLNGEILQGLVYRRAVEFHLCMIGIDG